jgi:hypothetical protein
LNREAHVDLDGTLVRRVIAGGCIVVFVPARGERSNVRAHFRRIGFQKELDFRSSLERQLAIVLDRLLLVLGTALLELRCVPDDIDPVVLTGSDLAGGVFEPSSVLGQQPRTACWDPHQTSFTPSLELKSRWSDPVRHGTPVGISVRTNVYVTVSQSTTSKKQMIGSKHCYLMALLVAVACGKVHETAPTAATEPADLRKVTLNLAGQRIEASLPTRWRLLAQQSDESAGLVAFENEQSTVERSESMFVDGSRAVWTPTSLDEARKRALSDDDCPSTGTCTELAFSDAEAVRSVIVKKPTAVFVRSWRRAPDGRGIRCGAEASALGALSPPTWLTDDRETERVGREIEALCRAVKPAP